jgi:hypothetical protein
MVLFGVAVYIAAVLLGLMWIAVAFLLQWPCQFSIRTLLALMCGCALVAGWFSWKRADAARQEKAVLVFSELGAGWGWDDTEGRAPDWLIDVFGPFFFSDVARLYVSGDIPDSEMRQLAALVRLRELNIENNRKFTGAAIAYCERSSQLETLDFVGTGIDDVGLLHIGGLRNVRRLIVISGHITDRGLQHLTGLTNLEELVLEDMPLTLKQAKANGVFWRGVA